MVELSPTISVSTIIQMNPLTHMLEDSDFQAGKKILYLHEIFFIHSEIKLQVTEWENYVRQSGNCHISVRQNRP